MFDNLTVSHLLKNVPIFMDPKVHYHSPKSLPLELILSKVNPVTTCLTPILILSSHQYLSTRCQNLKHSFLPSSFSPKPQIDMHINKNDNYDSSSNRFRYFSLLCIVNTSFTNILNPNLALVVDTTIF